MLAMAWSLSCISDSCGKDANKVKCLSSQGYTLKVNLINFRISFALLHAVMNRVSQAC